MQPEPDRKTQEDHEATRPPWVVVVSPIPLFPVRGGGPARILGYMRYLRSKGFRIGLVTVHHRGLARKRLAGEVDALWIARPRLSDNGIPLSNRLRELGRFLPEPIQFLLRRGMNTWRARRLHHVDVTGARPQASALASARNPLLERTARDVLASKQPVAAIACFAWTARCLDSAPAATCRIIDAIDIQHVRAREAREAGFELAGNNCTVEEELAELRRADAILAIQEAEFVALRSLLPDRSVILCEHTYPITAGHHSAPAEAATLFFVGNYYAPNNDGINLFLSKAWPRIRAARPDATLHICGKVCAAVSKAPPGVICAGTVDDLAPYYRDAAIVINPVPYGTGLKIKTVEALCEGKALVTTTAGVAGLPQEGDLPYAISTIEDMAGPVLHWLADPEQRKAVEEKARNFAKQRFAAHVAYRGLENLLWDAAGMGAAEETQHAVQEGNIL